jgi:hypothetical protein
MGEELGSPFSPVVGGGDRSGFLKGIQVVFDSFDS